MFGFPISAYYHNYTVPISLEGSILSSCLFILILSSDDALQIHVNRCCHSSRIPLKSNYSSWSISNFHWSPCTFHEAPTGKHTPGSSLNLLPLLVTFNIVLIGWAFHRVTKRVRKHTLFVGSNVRTLPLSAVNSGNFFQLLTRPYPVSPVSLFGTVGCPVSDQFILPKPAFYRVDRYCIRQKNNQHWSWLIFWPLQFSYNFELLLPLKGLPSTATVRQSSTLSALEIPPGSFSSTRPSASHPQTNLLICATHLHFQPPRCTPLKSFLRLFLGAFFLRNHLMVYFTCLGGEASVSQGQGLIADELGKAIVESMHESWYISRPQRERIPLRRGEKRKAPKTHTPRFDPRSPHFSSLTNQ